MSTDATPLEEMDRDELESRVKDLEAVGAVMAKFINELRDVPEEDEVGYKDPEFIPIAAKTFEELGERLQDHDDTLKRLDSTVKESRSATGSTDDENWWNVVEKAHEVKNDSKHALPGNQVKLYRDQISHACDVSKKRGQQLISEWADESDPAYEKKGKQGTGFQPYRAATAANNNEKQRKALIVDLDVWEEPE